MKYKIEKNTVQETLILPLYSRKLCTELYPNLYRDETAVRLIDQINYDFSEAEKNSRSLMQRFGALEVAMRQNDLAFEVQAYLKNHPCAAVVNLGCGLDNTGRACDNGRYKIYNLDFPDVIALRQQLLPAGEREQNIPCNLKDPAWFDKIDASGGAVFFASGVFYYFLTQQIKALVQGVSRARLVDLNESGPYLSANVELMPEPEAVAPESEQEALIRFAREQCERILSLRGIPTGDIMGVLSNVNEPGRLSDLIAANLRLKMEEAQEILQCIDPMDRLRLIITHLVHESEVATMQIKIQTSAREGMDKAQKEYYLREQLKAIRKELGDGPDADEELEDITKAIEKAGLTPEEVPVRGGTDGATLSWKGLPCPNLGTGGFNFHGVCECTTVERMDKATEILLNIVEIYSK